MSATADQTKTFSTRLLEYHQNPNGDPEEGMRLLEEIIVCGETALAALIRSMGTEQVDKLLGVELFVAGYSMAVLDTLNEYFPSTSRENLN